MPFESEKQRRYLYANEPDVAKKFKDDSRATRGMLKKAIASSMDLQDYARMRSGGLISTSKKVKGVPDFNTALRKKFGDK
tara:strand:+ start:237 stop:476 length:240 start_codon:yes stop_codon:yes gene_type:complete